MVFKTQASFFTFACPSILYCKVFGDRLYLMLVERKINLQSVLHYPLCQLVCPLSLLSLRYVLSICHVPDMGIK